jgi:uncharacterized membrane protein YdbT with pleckstrin-like domain
MSHVGKNLLSGESVVYWTRPHWIVCLKPALVVLLLGVMAGLAVKVATSGLPAEMSARVINQFLIISAFVFVAAVVIPLLLRLVVECAVTNKRIVLKTGLLKVRTVEMFLNRVESVVVEQSLLGRLLGYGTMLARGAGGTPEPFHRIAKVKEFQRQIQEQIRQTNEQGQAAAFK